jgi:hypothetical protein
MGVQLTFLKQHHITHEPFLKVEASSEDLPWDRLQSIHVVGNDFSDGAQHQMRRYLSECRRRVSCEIREHQVERFNFCNKKRSKRLRKAKKSIEKAISRLRFSKQESKPKSLWQEIQVRQERLMQERWPLILERELDYNQFHFFVKPHVAKLLSSPADFVVTSKGEITHKKNLKSGQKAVQSPALSHLCAKLRQLEAQLDVYHPQFLPKSSEGKWPQQLQEYIEESLEATCCQCPNCRKNMISICTETGQLFCAEHRPSKSSESLDWVHSLTQGLEKMKHAATR